MTQTPHDMTPVFSPETLGFTEGLDFRQGLERLSERGEIKAKLLLVALSHFAKRGYDGVQVREVAEEAGVSKPTLYYHFISKEGLFRQLCLVSMAATAHRIQAMVKPLLELDLKNAQVREEACRQLGRDYLRALQEFPEFTGFIHTAFGCGFEQARKEMLLFTGMFNSLVEEQLRHSDYDAGPEEADWVTGRWLRGMAQPSA